ncbi:MAG: sensor histidine kinase [Planctomycetaceae bacterium]|nr:sensor histidine kinase [Planctomycetaceae bacterium]
MKTTLLTKILLLDVVMVATMLILTVALSARYSVKQVELSQGQNLHNIAHILATSEPIISALKAGKSSPELDAFLDNVIASQNNVDVITIADMHSVRLYHPDRSRVGETFIGGDEGRALRGEHYLSQAVGTLGFQSRYFYPIFDHDGAQLGFAHVSMLMANLDSLRANVLRVNLQTLAIVLLVGALAAGILTMSIKRSLLGYEPDQLARFFVQRGEVMDSLEEGLLAVDEHGAIILANGATERILGITEENMRGKDVDSVIPEIGLKKSLGGAKDTNLAITLGDENILFSRMPLNRKHRRIGAMAIMRDHSEVTRMAEQLTGVNHLLDALRANTHEFMNRLHVILGLLQGGNVDEAKRYIMDISHVQRATITTMTKTIGNQTLAALILGKINRCNELGIRMHVRSDSAIPRRSRFLPTTALVTIVGNLVENSIDAIQEKGASEGEAEIALLIFEDDRALRISLDDTGIGLSPEELAGIERPGYTTKGVNRGTGLGLIRGIVENYGGGMTVDSEKGVGTSMTLAFRQTRSVNRNAESFRQA